MSADSAPARIWLSDFTIGLAVGRPEGTEYVRADLASPPSETREIERLRLALGQVLWMTGGEASREQLRAIRDYVADKLDPPTATPEDRNEAR